MRTPRRIEITVSEETWGRLNSARGHEPRASFVKRALESALGRAESVDASPVRSSEPERVVGSSAPDPVSTRASVKKVQVALEARDAVQKRNAEKTYSCPKAGCIYVSDSPGVCVHHRTERLR